ncbi:hypothetical protein J6590_016763 [Homalodisca vitripennis]|nr:hypothetical protein J6590_016763 [Homalodisca vitripennis]
MSLLVWLDHLIHFAWPWTCDSDPLWSHLSSQKEASGLLSHTWSTSGEGFEGKHSLGGKEEPMAATLVRSLHIEQTELTVCADLRSGHARSDICPQCN